MRMPTSTGKRGCKGKPIRSRISRKEIIERVDRVRELSRQREERQERERENKRQKELRLARQRRQAKEEEERKQAKETARRTEEERKRRALLGEPKRKRSMRSQDTRRIGTLLFRFGRGSTSRTRGCAACLTRQATLGHPPTPTPSTTIQEAGEASQDRALTRRRRGARVVSGATVDGCTGKTRVEPTAPESGALPPSGRASLQKVDVCVTGIPPSHAHQISIGEAGAT
jgi:hypothetical protein